MQTINDVNIQRHGVKTYDFLKVRSILEAKSVFIALKRVFDVLVSLFLIVFLSPFFLLIALLIKIDTPGSVFFMHRRAGFQGAEFLMLKFRTMKEGTEFIFRNEDKAKIERYGYHPKPKNDPRITKVGRILRRTSLDELPQLFNVLLGDMSIVGPRPVMDYMRKPYMSIQILREQVKPGITGLWQICDRENGFVITSMVKYDLEYMEKMSFKEDFRILMRTIPAVISGRGAH